MTVRAATANDMNAVLEHAQALATTFEVDPKAFADIFTHHLNNPASAIFVAEQDSEIVGYCLGHDRPVFFANGITSWLEEIFVLKSNRQYGLGRQLMDAFEAWARSRNSKMIALATRRAPLFYEAIGFEDSATYFRKLL